MNDRQHLSANLLAFQHTKILGSFSHLQSSFPRVAPVKEDVAVLGQSEIKSQTEFQGRSKYLRPGTAAAAYKKRSQKHFT